MLILNRVLIFIRKMETYAGIICGSRKMPKTLLLKFEKAKSCRCSTTRLRVNLFMLHCSIWFGFMVDIVVAVNDQTLVPDAAGCDVAKAAYDRVKSSGIFKTDDKFLLIRVAYTSKFGKKITVTGTKGIWHLPQPSLKKAQDISAKLNYVDKIRNILCIEFEKATFEDYRKPLYSAVGAALLIEEEGKKFR